MGANTNFALLLDLDAIDTLPVASLPKILADTLAVQSRIVERLKATTPTARQPSFIEDELLDVDQAAKLLGRSRGWLYHHAKDFPFTKRNGRALLFSRHGIRKYLEKQKG